MLIVQVVMHALSELCEPLEAFELSNSLLGTLAVLALPHHVLDLDGIVVHSSSPDLLVMNGALHSH